MNGIQQQQQQQSQQQQQQQNPYVLNNRPSSAQQYDPKKEEVLHQYADFLNELTFNSRNHINVLTTEAQANSVYHVDIVKIIENRIRKAPPPQKLPVLYLLDSIVKNVGGVYKAEFSKNIVSTFMGAFNTIRDKNIRAQYLRLLKTWPQHFPPEKVQQIEQMISSQQQQQFPAQPMQPSWPGSVPMMSSQYPPAGQQMPMSQPVNPYVGAAPQGQQWRQPQPQYGMMYPPPPPQPQQPQPQAHSGVYVNPAFYHRPGPGVQQLQQPPQPQTHQQNPYSMTMMMPPAPAQPGYPGGAAYMSNGVPFQQQPPAPPSLQSPPSTQNSRTPSPAVPVITAGLMDALKGLKRMQSATPPPAGGLDSTTSSTSVVASRSPSPDSNKHLSAPEADSMVHSLYDAMALKCSNCGLRFRSQNKLNRHLDKHYHAQKFRKDNKVLSRKWFQPVNSWIVEAEDNVLESPGDVLFSGGSAAAVAEAAATAASGVADVASETEGMPDAPADESQDTCTVCTEGFESYYDDKQDEWLYRDAVRDLASGIIVHRACYSSFKKDQEDDNGSDEPRSKRQKIV